MSFKYYVNWWIKNKEELEILKKRDDAFRQKYTDEVKDRNIANKLVGGMYARYCMLVQELDLCLDQLAQPQKTVAIRKMVDFAVMRLKELFSELRHIDFSEYHYIDDALIELKLIPYDIEILHPYLSYPRPYDIQQMYERFKRGETIYVRPTVVEPVEQEGNPDEAAPETDAAGSPAADPGAAPTTDPAAAPATDPAAAPPTDQAAAPATEDAEAAQKGKKKKKGKRASLMMDKKDVLTPEQIEAQKREAEITAAVQLIQRHERARQARLYHSECYAVYLMHQEEADKTKEKKEEYTPEQIEAAAVKVQKIIRGHYWRMYMKKKEDQRRLLIGMTESSFSTRKEFEKEEDEVEKRRNLRELRIKEYIDANLAEKDRILRVVGPGLMEDIGDEIREWFYQWYIRARTFDKFPPEEKGGTILVVRGETMTPEEWIEEVERRRREKVKAGGSKEQKAKLKAEKAKQKALAKAAAKAKKAALKLAMKEKKKRRKDVVNYQLEFDDPEGVGVYAEGQEDHEKIWNDRDEMLNPAETHYMDLITDQRCYEVQLEMREIVDEMMRLELELLEDALARDKNKKRKKPKKKKKKKKKGKKPPKDITKDRTVEDLFQELVDNGIIRTYPKTRFDEFIGDFSYNNMELRRDEFMDPPPCLGDVKQIISVNLVLPLGLSSCKGKVRSAIICGPPQSGKKILANAIFTSTRCVLFDLSPEGWAGKYPEKAGMNMLIHLVNKMSRILQPSILFFNAAEKPFYKKVPPAEREMEPKRMGKVLQKKIIKTIKPEDRVMVLGLTSEPWKAAKKMNKAYEMAILIPRSDYGSVFLYWRKLLMPYHGVDRDIDLSCLTKLTVNYPLGVIKDVTKSIMTPARIVSFYYRPLGQAELFEPFTKLSPITDKIWKKYEKWYKGTPVGKLGKKFGKVKLAQREDLLKRREAEKQKEEKDKKKKRR